MKKILMLILILICFTQCNSSTKTKISKEDQTEQKIAKENNFDESLNKVEKSINNNEVQIKKDSTIYDIDSIDVKPDFEGGIERFQKFIRYNFKYYEEEIPVKGIVEVNFVVEKDGTLSTIKVTKDVGYNTGNEAIRVLKKAPKWIPGTNNDRLVRVLYHLSIPMDNSYNYQD
ncbi:energy transducer TonB [Flavobacterium branchiicola]|uniref:Energy transducer TonB n=1 Tax=Flavobacterium branchiicola TaxID=1114875 RepID=A0ABV9PGU0_9FLAO|nr:energy transducer TonB [Flavobacterium branchiicola]MBS7254311.1 energy transducer TonB [Flavobacterium branchiicola]